MRLTLAAVVCLLCVARAHAKPPACFPERTVLWAATLVDAEGNAFAGVRAGQVVRVVDDAVGENGKLAEIELDGPVKLRGRVSRRQLLVFARGEIVIEPNESWLIEEAPLWIDSGDDAQAIVKRAEPHGSPSRFSRVRAACSQLRGTPPKKLFESDCHGASHASPTRVSGRLVEFDEPPKLESVSGRVSAPDTTRFGLLERRGDRALVEYVDEWGEWTRIRGWTATKGMKPLPRDASGYGFGHLCCEGRSFAELDRDEPVRRLERAVGLRAVPQGAVVGGLPRGATVQVIGAFDSELLVVHTGKLAGRGWTGVSVRAWVPADALSGRQPSPSVIRGRLSYPEAIGSEVLADVYARTSNRQWVRGRVLTDGVFEVPVLYEQESIEIKAIARDRAWLGAFEPLWRGKDFVLHMQRARELAATVVTSEGNPIPNVSIRLHPRSYRDMPSARTDAQGMFVLRAFPEEQDMLLLSAPGFLEHDFFLKGSLPPRIVLRRASLIAGAVGRDARGACLGREIYAEGREIAVADDCTFVVERTWEGVTTINGRWQPRQHVTLDYKGEQPYAQSCDPDATGGVGSPTLRCDVEGDVTDVCLGEHCASDERASVFVRVLGVDGALVPETRVEVFAAERKLGECVAKSGACFVHGLQPKLAVEVRARMAERMLRGATTTSATTVREVSLR